MISGLFYEWWWWWLFTALFQLLMFGWYVFWTFWHHFINYSKYYLFLRYFCHNISINAFSWLLLDVALSFGQYFLLISPSCLFRAIQELERKREISDNIQGLPGTKEKTEHAVLIKTTGLDKLLVKIIVTVLYINHLFFNFIFQKTRTWKVKMYKFTWQEQHLKAKKIIQCSLFYLSQL